MEYEINGIIKFFASDKLKLSKRLDFTSPSGARVGLDSSSNNDITVEIFLEAESDDDARAIAEIELSRTCNLLSFFYNVPISKSSIKGMVLVSRNHEGNIVCTGKAMVALDAILSHFHELNAQSVEKLAHRLEKEYPVNFEDIIYMWKEAISIEEPALKYLLLYRLMEFLFGGNTKELTDWIVAKDSSVPLYHEKRSKRYITHYTHLRDNIHRKTRDFPFKDIKDALPKLQDLTKQAIEENYRIIDGGS